MNWKDQAWSAWTEMQQDPGFMNLVAGCNGTLEKAAGKQGKGEGKGK